MLAEDLLHPWVALAVAEGHQAWLRVVVAEAVVVEVLPHLLWLLVGEQEGVAGWMASVAAAMVA